MQPKAELLVNNAPITHNIFNFSANWSFSGSQTIRLVKGTDNIITIRLTRLVSRALKIDYMEIFHYIDQLNNAFFRVNDVDGNDQLSVDLLSGHVDGDIPIYS